MKEEEERKGPGSLRVEVLEFWVVLVGVGWGLGVRLWNMNIK